MREYTPTAYSIIFFVQTEIRLTLQMFSVAAIAQTVELVKLIDAEPLAAPMTFVESPMSATLTVGVSH